MPLHLLGKKSWNVYNADNIARVRRDEATAKAAEEEEERRMQEVDAQRRLAILRGEAPPPIEDERDVESEKTRGTPSDARSQFPGHGRRRRKRPGEDDTEFELRLATERNDATYAVVESSRKPASSAPIVDHAGHIDLFGDERARAHAEKNEEAEAEKKKKEKEYEDQYTMRFSNAAGKDGISRPWYSQREGAAPDASSKDVWGNNDPNRKSRDAQRISSNDPLAMMKKGASQIRELKKERMKIQEERDEELRQLRKERHRDRHRDRYREREEREGRGHSDPRRHDSRRRRSKERNTDKSERRDDHNERRRHKEEERRRRHGGSRSRSPDRRLHRHRRDER
ncbi:homocitrate synthase [Trichoderma arundinaceum]|uniref:Homocitrate synthase n=1 Tax=Trichoderma arundinaceum TaxID=490622 RepID=A0A395NSN5_TRIAR|nr:homocitrate synthase [Trichoderma arundinaceum]